MHNSHCKRVFTEHSARSIMRMPTICNLCNMCSRFGLELISRHSLTPCSMCISLWPVEIGCRVSVHWRTENFWSLEVVVVFLDGMGQRDDTFALLRHWVAYDTKLQWCRSMFFFLFRADAFQMFIAHTAFYHAHMCRGRRGQTADCRIDNFPDTKKKTTAKMIY